MKETLSVVFAGDVDHGKSTLIGKLIELTDSMPKTRIEAVKNLCVLQEREFEPAYLLDAFEEERKGDFTLDTSYYTLRLTTKDVLVIDTPGHCEYVDKMMTGGSYAKTGVLVFDVTQEVNDAHLRHARYMWLLGIKNLTIVLNKMDSVDYSQDIFSSQVSKIQNILKPLNFDKTHFIPISAKKGDGLLKLIDFFENAKSEETVEEFKIQIQGSYQSVYFGVVLSGKYHEKIKIFAHNNQNITLIFDQDRLQKGDCFSFTVTPNISLQRGDILGKTDAHKEITLQLVLFQKNISEGKVIINVGLKETEGLIKKEENDDTYSIVFEKPQFFSEANPRILIKRDHQTLGVGTIV